MRYLISDLHLGHRDIIDLYDRPFDSVDEMEKTIQSNWAAAINSNDSVIFLGDFGGPDATREDLWRWQGKFDGIEVIVRGNHEPFGHPDITDTQLPLVEQFEFEYKDTKFECTHDPYALSDDFDGWGIHGHVHDGKIDAYPFIDPEEQRVNVSAEILGYCPVGLDELTEYIAKGREYKYRPKEQYF